MWFKRTAKNRRLGREHVLDVKLRSTKVRATRARMAAVALEVVFASVLSVYLAWRGADWGLNQLVYQNATFSIRQIDVQTDGVLPLDKLRRWTGVKYGDNLLALDLARVKRDLEIVSLIESASVERILPNTLRVPVTEREPLAQIRVLRPRPGGGIDSLPFGLQQGSEEVWLGHPTVQSTFPDLCNLGSFMHVAAGEHGRKWWRGSARFRTAPANRAVSCSRRPMRAVRRNRRRGAAAEADDAAF